MYEILLKSDLFKGLSEEELDIIVEKCGSILSYKDEELVFLIGSEPKYMYILLEGSVEVYRENALGGKELLQYFNTPGVLFGEIYLGLKNRVYDFSCQCKEDTKLLALNHKFFDFIVSGTENYSKIVLSNYIEILTTKTMILNRKVRILSGGSLRQKISRYLIEYSVDNIVEDKYNREELAQYLATTRPSISRELNNMKNEGLIDIVPGKIIILEKEKLAKNY